MSEVKVKDWSEPDNKGNIDVPDDLFPFMNKVNFQFGFVLISGKNEILAAAHIVQGAEEFFHKRYNDSFPSEQEAISHAEKEYVTDKLSEREKVLIRAITKWVKGQVMEKNKLHHPFPLLRSPAHR